MRNRALFALVVILFLASFIPYQTVSADGIIIPEPPICPQPGPRDPAPPCPPWPQPIPMQQLAIKYHHVSVQIENQVAVTHVDQVFYNPNDWIIEGTYLFPLPAEAVVTQFTLWIDGEPVEGQVLDANQARQKYEEIVYSMRDPALLEYAGRGAVQARVFPIPPQGERRIELEYSQALAAENGLVRYTYPLNTEKFSALPLESVRINIEIETSEPIRAVYSPTHSVDVQRGSRFEAVAAYEENDVTPQSDFSLYYSVGESQAFHLLSYRNPADRDDPDGFYLLMLAPRPDEEAAAVPKDVILVLDRSGSMEGEKFRQAQEALRFVLGHLNPDDRFNLIAFSSGLDSYARELRPAGEANEAVGWVNRLQAAGSTDINRALLEAADLVEPGRPTYLIFLTDGLPTEGETIPDRILANFSGSAPQNLRLFSFGVGYDVDTILLDTLAQENHGASSYVRPEEPLDEILSAFYARVSTPVMTGLDLAFGDLEAYDAYPSPLPDLFFGSQIIAVGRYREGGATNITLTGEVNGKRHTYQFAGQEFSEESASDPGTLAALPRLWATRKIGYLLSQLRLKGNDQETIDQIVKLSIRYGIVTEYTSYLVTEDMPLGADAQQRIAEEQFNQFQSTEAPRSGQAAVEKAAGQADLESASAPAASPEESASQMKFAGSRTFVMNQGVWMDTGYDPGQAAPRQILFLSDEYLSLSRERPDLALIMALGERVIFLDHGTAFEIIPNDQPENPRLFPVTITQTPVEIAQLEPSPTPQPGVSPTPTPAGTPADPAPAQPSCLLALIPLGLLIFIGKSLKGR